MSYEMLMTKIANADLPINAQLMDIINRVKVAGLHNVAGPLTGISDFNIKTASQHIGTQMLRTHCKYQKIAQGLSVYPDDTNLDLLKQAGLMNMLRSRLGSGLAEGAAAGAKPALQSGGLSRLAGPVGVPNRHFSPSSEVVNAFQPSVQRALAPYRKAQDTAAAAAAGLQRNPSSMRRSQMSTAPDLQPLPAKKPSLLEQYSGTPDSIARLNPQAKKRLL